MVNRKVIFAGIAIVLLLFMGWASMIMLRNGLNSAKLEVDNQKGNIAAKLQDRHDVIPSMVKVAEASIKAQDKILSNYARNREGLDQAQKLYNEGLNDPNDPDSVVKMDNAIRNAQKSFDGIIINARRESVPEVDIKAMVIVQNEVAGRQNAISAYRVDYNNAVKAYNEKVINAPSSWVAEHYGYKTLKMFEAAEGAEEMPDTNIDI